MPYINTPALTVTDQVIANRKTKKLALRRINKLIDWNIIDQVLKKYYPKGLKDRGRRAYPPLLLFKMSLLQTWYALSDEAIESELLDSLAFMEFCGLYLTQNVPDHSVLCRFRKKLTEQHAYDQLLALINKQLSNQGLLVKQGSIVDASITPTLRKLDKKPTYLLKTEAPSVPLDVVPQAGVDQEAQWSKKGNRFYYGYKRHVLVDVQDGLVLAVHTSSANEHDSKHLSSVLPKVSLPASSEVLGDKGYSSKSNEELLKGYGLKSRLQKRRSRGAEGSKWLSRYNRAIGKRRYKVERTFGSIKRWFKSSCTRYVGLAKTHSQHVLESIAYNLYRLPGLEIKALSRV